MSRSDRAISVFRELCTAGGLMKIKTLHDWPASPQEAIALQRELAPQVRLTPVRRTVRYFAGTDAAFSPDGAEVIAGVVLWDLTRNEIGEQHVARTPCVFPYVPGLLSFRETPALLAVLAKLKTEPDVLLCDAQGLAHPRRFGLACHVGLWLEIATVGCAKSRLCGDFDEPAAAKGSGSTLRHNDEARRHRAAHARTRQPALRQPRTSLRPHISRAPDAHGNDALPPARADPAGAPRRDARALASLRARFQEQRSGRRPGRPVRTADLRRAAQGAAQQSLLKLAQGPSATQWAQRSARPSENKNARGQLRSRASVKRVVGSLLLVLNFLDLNLDPEFLRAGLGRGVDGDRARLAAGILTLERKLEGLKVVGRLDGYG